MFHFIMTSSRFITIPILILIPILTLVLYYYNFVQSWINFLYWFIFCFGTGIALYLFIIISATFPFWLIIIYGLATVIYHFVMTTPWSSFPLWFISIFLLSKASKQCVYLIYDIHDDYVEISIDCIAWGFLLWLMITRSKVLTEARFPPKKNEINDKIKIK